MSESDEIRASGGARPAPAAESPPPLIEAQGLSVRFGDHVVLDHVDVAIRPGEIVTLVGLNGSGKSTLARALLGLVPIAGGIIRRSPDLRIGYLPQSMPQDATLPLTVRRFLSLAGRFPRATLMAQLEELGVAPLADAQIATLSGGEIRRVMLGRALLRRPHLLVLDEPMSGVDVAGQAELYRLIARIRRQHGCGVLLISHDLHLVMAETDIVVCLNHHVCCAGRPHSVVRDPSFAALFGQDVAKALAIYRHDHDHVHDAHGDVHPRAHDHDHAGPTRGPTGPTSGPTLSASSQDSRNG